MSCTSVDIRCHVFVMDVHSRIIVSIRLVPLCLPCYPQPRSDEWKTDPGFHELWRIMECLSRVLVHTLGVIITTFTSHLGTMERVICLRLGSYMPYNMSEPVEIHIKFENMASFAHFPLISLKF